MLSMETLDERMDTTIRDGLRSAMAYIIPSETDPLTEVRARLDEYLHDPLYAEILTAYDTGYAAGLQKIQQHATVDAAYAMIRDSVEPDDPLIQKATSEAITGIQYLVDGQKDAVLEIVSTQLARGATVTRIRSGLLNYFDDNPAATQRFARTLVTDIYTRASLNRYVDSGVVDGAQFAAHMDTVTSKVCRMYHKTIWRLGDPGIQRPPLHFNCRSDLLPYFGEIPGPRDFITEFGTEYVDEALTDTDTFRQKYWSLGIDSHRPTTDSVDAAYARSYI